MLKREGRFYRNSDVCPKVQKLPLPRFFATVRPYSHRRPVVSFIFEIHYLSTFIEGKHNREYCSQNIKENGTFYVLCNLCIVNKYWRKWPDYFLLSGCMSVVHSIYVYLEFGAVRLLLNIWNLFFFLLWRCDPTRVMASSFLRFVDHIQRHTTVRRTPLGEWSARRRDLYLTTHNTHNRQTSMPPVGFEPTISAGERPQTYALDRAATGTGI